MKLFRVRSPEKFDDAPETAMDMHLAASQEGDAYAVIGSRVAFLLLDPRERGETQETDSIALDWRSKSIDAAERKDLFTAWLNDLDTAPELDPRSRDEFVQEIRPRRSHDRNGEIIGFIVGPLAALPSPPLRPTSIYGHLPFGTLTDPDTVIYRWEAFPSSRRITRTSSGGEIARDTYGAPASEVPFAPTGFGAVARFALPNLMPACFRWELQPIASTFIECGASVPLYGQSGGGVEVRFPRKTQNRCPIANPVVLPAM